MALIVAPDDGYESLVSLSDAEAYFVKMGYAWTGTDGAKETYLRRATQYLLNYYRIRPEYLDPVNQNVADACCEAALRASTGALLADIDGQYVERVKVGPIERQLSAPRNAGQRRYAVIDALLRGLTYGSMSAVEVVRS